MSGLWMWIRILWLKIAYIAVMRKFVYVWLDLLILCHKYNRFENSDYQDKIIFVCKKISERIHFPTVSRQISNNRYFLQLTVKFRQGSGSPFFQDSIRAEITSATVCFIFFHLMWGTLGSRPNFCKVEMDLTQPDGNLMTVKATALAVQRCKWSTGRPSILLRFSPLQLTILILNILIIYMLITLTFQIQHSLNKKTRVLYWASYHPTIDCSSYSW